MNSSCFTDFCKGEENKITSIYNAQEFLCIQQEHVDKHLTHDELGKYPEFQSDG